MSVTQNVNTIDGRNIIKRGIRTNVQCTIIVIIALSHLTINIIVTMILYIVFHITTILIILDIVKADSLECHTLLEFIILETYTDKNSVQLRIEIDRQKFERYTEI